MKPSLNKNHDNIEAMLANSWEAMPIHLEEQLLDVPNQLRSQQVERFDKLAFVLNSILAIWTLGLIYTFKDTIGINVMGLTTKLSAVGSFLPTIISHPVFLVLVIGLLGFTWWRLDMDTT